MFIYCVSSLSEETTLGKQCKNFRMQCVAKKPLGENRRNNLAMGSIKYGVRIPKNVKDVLMMNEFNKDNLWKKAIV